MLNKNLFTLLSYLLLTGCGMIDYHPHNGGTMKRRIS